MRQNSRKFDIVVELSHDITCQLYGESRTGQVPPWMILSKLNGPGISFILKMGELGLEAAGDGILMSLASDYAEEGRLLTIDS